MATTFMKIFWNAVVSKVLVSEKEPNNSQDRYTVAVKMNIPRV